jgi:hypothetical protein
MNDYPSHFRKSLFKKKFAGGGPVGEDTDYELRDYDDPRLARHPAEATNRLRQRYADTLPGGKEDPANMRAAMEADKKYKDLDVDDALYKARGWKTGDDPSFQGMKKGGLVKKSK